MGKDNTLLLIGGAVLAYMLLPDKTKESIIPGGGGTNITLPNISLGGTSIDLGDAKPESESPISPGGIFTTIKEAVERAVKDYMPDLPSGEDIIPDKPGDIVDLVEEAVEEAVKDIIPDIPGKGDIVDLVKEAVKEVIPGIPGLPGVPDLGIPSPEGVLNYDPNETSIWDYWYDLVSGWQGFLPSGNRLIWPRIRLAEIETEYSKAVGERPPVDDTKPGREFPLTTFERTGWNKTALKRLHETRMRDQKEGEIGIPDPDTVIPRPW